MYVVTVRRSRSVCFLIFADLAGVEGLWVPLRLGDVPSLLEHLENNQHGERSLTLPSLWVFWEFLFILHVWPQLTRQLELCLFPQNFSGTAATYRRICQAATLAPCQKNFVLSYLLLSSRPKVYRSLVRLRQQSDKFASPSRPLILFLCQLLSLVILVCKFDPGKCE
jgi:hypothetical protein